MAASIGFEPMHAFTHLTV